MLDYFKRGFQKEVNSLVQLLKIRPGSVVGEVGSGDGTMAVAIAELVGPAGKVIATEVDPDNLTFLRALAKNFKFKNIVVKEGEQNRVDFPENVCDAIFMRSAYHHFTKPIELDRSLYQSLKPNGLVAVIDFTPTIWLRAWMPRDVPKNRGGHGMPKGLLVEEMEAAGFKVVEKIDSWFGRYYCYVFAKITEAASS